MRLPLGRWCVGVLQGVRGHIGARTAPIPEYVAAWRPMTRDALPWFVMSLARGAMGSCIWLEGTCGPVLHPSPPREWIEYVLAWRPMTRGALQSCAFPLACGALGVFTGLEGTCGPVLHPFPLSHLQLPFLTHSRLWLLVCSPLTPLSPSNPLGQPHHPFLHLARGFGLCPNLLLLRLGHEPLDFCKTSPPASMAQPNQTACTTLPPLR